MLLDCPLSGTGARARTRDLAVYASGDARSIRALASVFEGFARVRYDVGSFGKGMRMKLVANLLVAIHNVSTAEALMMGVRCGLDAATVVAKQTSPFSLARGSACARDEPGRADAHRKAGRAAWCSSGSTATLRDVQAACRGAEAPPALPPELEAELIRQARAGRTH